MTVEGRVEVQIAVSYHSLECFLDYIIVFKDEQMGRTAYGLLIPDHVQEEPLTGTVMACGPGYYDFEEGHWIPTLPKPGDKVVFNRYAGYETIIDGIPFMMMQSRNLFGKGRSEGVLFHVVERALDVNNIQYDHGESKYRHDQWS